MRFLNSSVFALTALAGWVTAATATGTATSSAAASASTSTLPNPITAPVGGTVVAGDGYEVKWTPTSTDAVTLELVRGDIDDLDSVTTIVSNIANSGSYTWTPSKDIEGGSDYSIRISTSEGTNYSPQFTISSSGTGLSSSTTATSTTSTSTTSTSISTPTSTSTTDIATSTSTTDIATSTSTGSTTAAALTTSAVVSGNATYTLSTSVRRTSTSSSSTASASAGGAISSLNAGGRLSSPLALVLGVAAGLIYFN